VLAAPVDSIRSHGTGSQLAVRFVGYGDFRGDGGGHGLMCEDGLETRLGERAGSR